MEEIKRDFKGIWIPKELIFDERLSYLEQYLLATIDSLDSGDGCFASNEYLAKIIKVKEHTISLAISNLKKYGLLSQISFDGRTRFLKSNMSYQVKADCHKNDTLTITKVTSSNNINNNIIFNSNDNKDYNKDYINSPPLENVDEKPIYKIPLKGNQFGNVYQNDIDEWKAAYPAIDVGNELCKMIAWCNANPTNKKSKTGYKRFINFWLNKANDRMPKARSNQSYEEQPVQTHYSKETQEIIDTFDRSKFEEF